MSIADGFYEDYVRSYEGGGEPLARPEWDRLYTAPVVLEYLRGQIQAECISYGEIAELQGLADQIAPGDVELLEWAGVPEFPLATYRVELLHPDCGQMFYDFQADDTDHAKEQAIDAEPSATVVSVKEVQA